MVAALDATIHVFDPRRKCLIDSEVPDLKVRQQAHDRLVALFGGIPKVGEPVPDAHGLNLFIAVNPERPQTSKPDPPTVVNAPNLSRTLVPVPRMSSTSNAPSPPTKIRVGIAIEDPVANRQPPRPIGGKSNATGEVERGVTQDLQLLQENGELRGLLTEFVPQTTQPAPSW